MEPRCLHARRARSDNRAVAAIRRPTRHRSPGPAERGGSISSSPSHGPSRAIGKAIAALADDPYPPEGLRSWFGPASRRPTCPSRPSRTSIARTFGPSGRYRGGSERWGGSWGLWCTGTSPTPRTSPVPAHHGAPGHHGTHQPHRARPAGHRPRPGRSRHTTPTVIPTIKTVSPQFARRLGPWMAYGLRGSGRRSNRPGFRRRQQPGRWGGQCQAERLSCLGRMDRSRASQPEGEQIMHRGLGLVAAHGLVTTRPAEGRSLRWIRRPGRGRGQGIKTSLPRTWPPWLMR
jgi:hypothetical protein